MNNLTKKFEAYVNDKGELKGFGDKFTKSYMFIPIKTAPNSHLDLYLKSSVEDAASDVYNEPFVLSEFGKREGFNIYNFNLKEVPTLIRILTDKYEEVGDPFLMTMISKIENRYKNG